MSRVTSKPTETSAEELTGESLPSIAAGVSWMFGIMSIPLLLVPPSAVATGLFAIVFGHAAKFSIKRRAELNGATTATNGLIMGYLCLLIGLVLLPSIHMQSTLTRGIWQSFCGVSSARPETKLAKAEAALLASSGTPLGNNERAEKISSALNEQLNELRHATFEGPVSFDVSTFCQSTPRGTCVLVLVPDFAEFGTDAREAMLNLCWKQSQEIAFGVPKPGDEFAIALRDRIRYQAMEFGRATLSPDRIAHPDASFVDMDLLEGFFEPKAKQSEESGQEAGDQEE